MRALLLAILALVSLPTLPQQDDPARAKRVIAAIERLLEQRPDDPTLWFYLSRYRAMDLDRAGAIAALEKVDALGDGFLPTRQEFASVWTEPRFQDVRSRMEARLPRLDYAPTAFEIPDRTLVPEGIAFDAPSRSFFVGSVRGKVLRVEEGGVVSEFASGLPDPLLGLAVDAPRRLLYVVSTSALTTAGQQQRRNAVIAFDIDARRELRRYDVPGAQQLNDVAIAPGGRVFASDSASGAIYEIAVKGPGPTRELVPAGRMGGSNGLAVSPDGKRLYVGHSTGLAVVDLASGEARRLANGTRESVSGIDGLYQWQGQLIGVQNVTTPGRVILVTLTRDGDAVQRVQTLLSHHHNALDEPTTGAVTPMGFYLLAATGVSRFNREGGIDRPEEMPNPTVVRIPLPR